ncbi:type II toxin-antitoxin system RelE/ParE family toxin [Candidatus Woesebacteria bacterium]|nr:type II toxin-antitoxin system RelE/ParE family toxin [Candidatus Woesebacteria bacterium]
MSIVEHRDRSGESCIASFIRREIKDQKQKMQIERDISRLSSFTFQQLTRNGWLEKIRDSGVWEYRCGFGKHIFRIFLGIQGQDYILLHIVHKKKNKLNPRDIRLAIKRYSQHII